MHPWKGLKAIIFRVTGLAGYLPPLLAACPSNSIMATETALQSLAVNLGRGPR